MADNFNRPSANTYVKCMEGCTKLISSALDAPESQHQQSDMWSICLNTVMVEEQQKILDNLTTLTKCFAIDDSREKNC